jgi:putative glycosyltransferase (TIGR04372 family)
MKNEVPKFLSKIFRGIAKLFSPFPLVEILSIHLGHTIIESATIIKKRPIAIVWREPIANKWLTEKIQENLRYPKINAWINKYYKKKGVLGTAIRMSFKNLSDQYWLFNLGYNYFSEGLTIKFSDKEEKNAENFMSKLGLIKNKYVCFCIRDESYYEEFKTDLQKISTGTSFAFRNAAIKNYVECAEELLRRGIKPVIMGFSSTRKTYPKKVVDVFSMPYSDPDFRPATEAYIFKNCSFCVGMMTGGTLYAKLFSRPVLWADIFWRGVPVGGKSDMIVPKKIFVSSDEGKEKRFLNFKEISDLGPPPNNDWSHFHKNGLSVLNNSSDDLKEALVDMLSYLDTKKYFQSSEEHELHKQFSIWHFSIIKKKLVTPTRLAPSWAKKNQDLLVAQSIMYSKYWTGIGSHQISVDDCFNRKKSEVLFGKKIEGLR